MFGKCYFNLTWGSKHIIKIMVIPVHWGWCAIERWWKRKANPNPPETQHQFLVTPLALVPKPDAAASSRWSRSRSSDGWEVVLVQPHSSSPLQSIERVGKAPGAACTFSPYNIRKRKTFSKRCVGRLTWSVFKIKETETTSIDISFTFLFANLCLYAPDSFKNNRQGEQK